MRASVLAAAVLTGLALRPPRGEAAMLPEDRAYFDEAIAKGEKKEDLKPLLKARQDRVEAQGKERQDFIENEEKLYKDFSAKKREDLEAFEQRLNRQLVTAAESLGAAGSGHRERILADLERLHGDLVRAFVQGRRQKDREFFAAGEKRWREHLSRLGEQLGAKAAAPAPAAPAAPSRAERPARPAKKPAPAAATAPIPLETALTGQVSSKEEPVMEGVLVTLTTQDNSMAVTVVSDKAGLYRFPGSKLSAGSYALSVRAATYELPESVEVSLSADRTVKLDLTLRKAEDYSGHLTSAEWILTVPGLEKQTRVTRGCVLCHTLERVVKSPFKPKEFEQTIWRMEGLYDYPSSDFRQVHIPKGTTLAQLPDPDYLRRTAEFLSSINLSESWDFKYPLKAFPRPRGRATRVIITEYFLPRENSMPNDVAVDAEGFVWYNDLSQPYLGRFDPRTRTTREWELPMFRQGFNGGSYFMQLDKHGDPWLARYRQNGVTRFDRKTETFTSYQAPAEFSNDASRAKALDVRQSDFDGKMWFDSASTAPYVARVDIKTGAVEMFDPFHPKHAAASGRKVRSWELHPSAGMHYIYGMAADSRNNVYVTDLFDSSIARIDAQTGAIKWWFIPDRGAGPRRATMDSQDRLWYSHWATNKVGMFDTKTEQFREWPIRTPYTNPWMVVVDKNGLVWGAGRHNDRVLRLDPAKGQTTEYLLPRVSQTHGSFVDDSTTPITFWAGNIPGHALVKLEPLD